MSIADLDPNNIENIEIRYSEEVMDQIRHIDEMISSRMFEWREREWPELTIQSLRDEIDELYMQKAAIIANAVPSAFVRVI